MLGDFITRFLVLLLGYAYPSFECFKAVEKNTVDIEELRFWCQYWIIVAMLAVLERISDILISWLPMYAEAKLAFLIYLWYPKTKGTGYIYETLLRPFIAKHETHIDRKLLEFKAKVWDLAIFYLQNLTEMGQTTFYQFLQFLAAQSAKFTNKNTQKADQQDPGSPPPSPSFDGAPEKKENQSGKNQKLPPGSTINSAISKTRESEVVQVNLHSSTKNVHIEETSESAINEAHLKDKLHEVRLRLKQFKPIH